MSASTEIESPAPLIPGSDGSDGCVLVAGTGGFLETKRSREPFVDAQA